LPVDAEELTSGTWALERGSLPGLPQGTELRIELSDKSLEVYGPNGRAIQMVLSDTSIEREVGGIRVRNRPDAVDLVLSSRTVREAQLPVVIVWSYPGRTQVEAGQLYASHAVQLDAKGYIPIAQSWGEGRPGLAGSS
jgi:hypothetical protein